MPDGPMKRLNWTRRPRKVVLVAFQRGWRGVTGWARRLQGAVAFAVRLVDRWLNESVRRVFRFLENRLGPITVVVTAVVVAISVVFWDWLSFGESGSTTIRNVGLVLAALVALPLAVWRSKVAERQASAAQRQADTAQQNLLNERYQRGAEMLGSEVLGVRLAGIYALESLAKEHPRQYHIQIVNLFCAFLRYPTGGERREEGQDTVEDVQIAVRAIGTRSRTGIELERKSDFRLDLFRANLAGASLLDADLGRAKLIRANLAGASLARANLCQADLTGANISGAHFYDFAGLMGIGERESAAKGLTQQQLNSARIDLNKRPDLDGHVLDAETGDPLVWLRK